MTSTLLRASRPLLLCCACLAIAACGDDDDGGGGNGGNGGGSIDITGQSPSEAAATLAEPICDWLVRCGETRISCSSGTGEPTTCSGEITRIERQECLDEFLPALADSLRDVPPGSQLESDVETCVRQVTSARCTTQDEIDAAVELIENGEDPEFIGARPPAACEAADAVFDGGGSAGGGGGGGGGGTDAPLPDPSGGN